jgi:formate hydrogenlyase transcriptional activator
MGEPDLDRFPSAFYKNLGGTGARATCSLPLTTSNGTLGTLELGRLTCTAFTDEDVNLGSQVARQIEIAIENSLAYRELAEMRDKVVLPTRNFGDGQSRRTIHSRRLSV